MTKDKTPPACGVCKEYEMVSLVCDPCIMKWINIAEKRGYNKALEEVFKEFDKIFGYELPKKYGAFKHHNTAKIGFRQYEKIKKELGGGERRMKCVWCGKEFRPIYGNEKLCSDICRTARHRHQIKKYHRKHYQKPEVKARKREYMREYRRTHKKRNSEVKKDDRV